MPERRAVGLWHPARQSGGLKRAVRLPAASHPRLPHTRLTVCPCSGSSCHRGRFSGANNFPARFQALRFAQSPNRTSRSTCDVQGPVLALEVQQRTGQAGPCSGGAELSRAREGCWCGRGLDSVQGMGARKQQAGWEAEAQCMGGKRQSRSEGSGTWTQAGAEAPKGS